MGSNASITYSSLYQPSVTIELGQRTGGDSKRIGREDTGLDIYLYRALALDCPLNLGILIRSDGTMVEWWAEFDNPSADTRNTYWHAVGNLPATVTQSQVVTLARIHYGTVQPFGIKGSLGRSATDAFEGYDRDAIEAAANITPGSVAYNDGSRVAH